MVDILTALSPVLVALTSGLAGLLLAKQNSRDKKSEQRDIQLKAIERNQEQISKSFQLISDLAENHASLLSETARQRDALKILLRNSLMQDHTRLMEQGYLTSYQLRDFEESYSVYHSEGGNGTATKWLEEIKTLPIHDEV